MGLGPRSDLPTTNEIHDPSSAQRVEYRYRLEGLIAVNRVVVEWVDGGWCARVLVVDDRTPLHSSEAHASFDDAVSAAETYIRARYPDATVTRETH